MFVCIVVPCAFTTQVRHIQFKTGMQNWHYDTFRTLLFWGLLLLCSL